MLVYMESIFARYQKKKCKYECKNETMLIISIWIIPGDYNSTFNVTDLKLLELSRVAFS